MRKVARWRTDCPSLAARSTPGDHHCIIIGAKRPDQLVANLAAVDIELSSDELSTLDKVSALPFEYPAWIFARQGDVRGKLVVRILDKAGYFCASIKSEIFVL